MTRRIPQYLSQDDSSRYTRQILPVPNSTHPYWRSERHPLDEHRSTSELPQQCDILIIGAGMSGVVLAYHILKEHGQGPIPSILLVEARQVCSGATGRNGGHAKVMTMSQQRTARNHGVEFADEMAQFFIDQNYALKALVETEQLDCEFELRRSFDVLLHEGEANALEAFFKESNRRSDVWTKEVDFVPKERAERVTSIKGAQCAFSDPACSFWPYKLVTSLLAKIIDRVNLQTYTLVTDVSVDDDGINTVRTDRGAVRAKKVVFASNAYTAGICPTYAGKIVPYKGTNSHLKPRHGPVYPHLNQTYNISYGPGKVNYLNPRPDGGIVVGGAKWTYEHDRQSWYNNWDDSTLLPQARSYFDGLMQRDFKGWEDSGSSLDALWTGIMGETADELPHVGKVVGQQSQYIMAGYNGGGMSIIALVAQGLAKMIVHDVPFAETGLPQRMETTRARLEKGTNDI